MLITIPPSPSLCVYFFRKNKDQTEFVGINTSTVYIGTEYSSFNCHIEDFVFESVNRLCAGSEKIWFVFSWIFTTGTLADWDLCYYTFLLLLLASRFIILPAYYKAFTIWFSMMGISAGGTDTNCFTFPQHKHNFIDPRKVLRAGFPVRTVSIHSLRLVGSPSSESHFDEPEISCFRWDSVLVTLFMYCHMQSTGE